MNFLIILGFCLTAAAAVPRYEYADTNAVQRSYSPYYDPNCQPDYYNYRPPYYPYYYETPSYYCYYKMYYNPYYSYNPYYDNNCYNSYCRAYRKGETYNYRSSYGHSGHEDNYNAPLYYAPGYQQGYKTYSDEHPSLYEQYSNRPEYLGNRGELNNYRSSYGHSGHENNYNVPLYYAPGYQQGYHTYADDHPSLQEQYYRPGYLGYYDNAKRD